MKKEDEVKQEELDVTLPSEILNQVDEDDDSDMPIPETAEYGEAAKADDNRALLPTQKFYQLFNECMGKLPYNAILKNANGDQLKLVDLFRFMEAKTSVGTTVKEMNTIMSFIASSPMEYVRPLMEIVESPERQKELWVLK